MCCEHGTIYNESLLHTFRGVRELSSSELCFRMCTSTHLQGVHLQRPNLRMCASVHPSLASISCAWSVHLSLARGKQRIIDEDASSAMQCNDVAQAPQYRLHVNRRIIKWAACVAILTSPSCVAISTSSTGLWHLCNHLRREFQAKNHARRCLQRHAVYWSGCSSAV